MTKLLLGLGVIAFLAVPASAQDVIPWWGSYYTPGNIALSATVNAGIDRFGRGFTAQLAPGAEVFVAKIRPADAFALDVGVGARGFLAVATGTQFLSGYVGFGGGPFVGLHLGFRGLGGTGAGLEYLEPLDLFTGFGAEYRVLTGIGAGIGLTNYSGFNYFLTDNIALKAMSSYYLGFGDVRSRWRGSLGMTYRIGPTEALGEAPDVRRIGEALEGNIAYLSFASVYWSMFAFTGWFADDLNYEIGDETMFRITYRENRDEESYTYTRTLLREEPDGRRWWPLEVDWTDFDDEQLPTAYEFVVDENHDILRLRYMDPVTERISTYEPHDPAAWRARTFRRIDDPEQYASRVRMEQVRVPAGTFRADVYRSHDEDVEFTWWLSDEVPGSLVKVEGRTVDDQSVEGELLRIRRDRLSPWPQPW